MTFQMLIDRTFDYFYLAAVTLNVRKELLISPFLPLETASMVNFVFVYRRIGRWLTPVKPLIPLLQSADSSSRNQCNFTMKTVPWAMAWVPTLNVRLVSKIEGESTTTLTINQLTSRLNLKRRSNWRFCEFPI